MSRKQDHGVTPSLPNSQTIWSVVARQDIFLNTNALLLTQRNANSCSWNVDSECLVTMEHVCNDHLMTFIHQTRSIHGRGLENNHRCQQDEKFRRETAHEACRESRWPIISLGCVPAPNDMQQDIDSAPLQIKWCDALIRDPSLATRKTTSVSTILETPATSSSNIVSFCNLQMASKDFTTIADAQRKWEQTALCKWPAMICSANAALTPTYKSLWNADNPHAEQHIQEIAKNEYVPDTALRNKLPKLNAHIAVFKSVQMCTTTATPSPTIMPCKAQIR